MLARQSSGPLTRLRSVLFVALAAAVIFTTTALAGSGVGGVFNLGQTNTVNGTSTLKGTSAGSQLRVENASIGTGAFSIYGLLSSATPGVSSTAVRGVNNGTGINGYGVWGTQVGQGVGVYGTA